MQIHFSKSLNNNVTYCGRVNVQNSYDLSIVTCLTCLNSAIVTANRSVLNRVPLFKEKLEKQIVKNNVKKNIIRRTKNNNRV